MSFSGNRAIFPAYTSALGFNTITGDYKDKIEGYYSSDSNFELIFKNPIVSSKNNLNDIVNTLRDKSVNVNKFETCLLNTDITTFNKDTNISSEYSYDEHQNISCSSRIFSDTVYENCNSWVMKDLDYDKENPMSVIGLNHWKNEYNFNTNYNSAEYRVYGIHKTFVEDNVSCLTASDLKYSYEGITAIRYVLLGYKQNDSNTIPMLYYDLGKPYYASKNYIEIDWHADGLVTLR